MSDSASKPQLPAKVVEQIVDVLGSWDRSSVMVWDEPVQTAMMEDEAVLLTIMTMFGLLYGAEQVATCMHKVIPADVARKHAATLAAKYGRTEEEILAFFIK